MDSVYLKALAMGLQDKVMVSLLGEELVTSTGGKTVAEKKRLFEKLKFFNPSLTVKLLSWGQAVLHCKGGAL